MPDSLVRNGSWRYRGRGPGDICKVEEVQQVRLGRVALGQRSGRTDEAIFDKLDHGCVVHWDVGNVVPARERRDHDIGEPETKLSSKSLLCCSIARIRAGIGRGQVAVRRSGSA